MEILSNSDGSAHAVREAAVASDSGDARTALERELDRLNGALDAQAQAATQHANWTLVAQAFLLMSYLIVLVGGWALPLPGKRWLLAAIAGFAILSLVLGTAAQRGARDRIGPLRSSRKLAEQALERVAGRPPVFSRERALAAIAGEWAARLMPWLIFAGWTALSVYTLALPFPNEARVAAVETRSEARAAAAPTAPAKAPRPTKNSAGKADEAPPAATDATSASATAENESPLAALLRRAINAAPAEPSETVKP